MPLLGRLTEHRPQGQVHRASCEQFRSSPWTYQASRLRSEKSRSSVLRYVDIVHKQRVNASLTESDHRVGRRADDRFAVVEGRIDDDRHTGSSEKAGYELVKAWI